MGIRERILIAFVLLLLLPLMGLGSVAVLNIKAMGKAAVDETSGQLLQEEKTNLGNLARDMASRIDLYFAGVQNDAAFLGAYADDLYANRSRYASIDYPSYRYGPPKTLAANLPAYGYINTSSGQGNGAWADWDGRLTGNPHLNSSVVKRAAADPAFGRRLSEELNLTMRMDLSFAPVYNKNQPDATLVWLIRLGGASNSYPRANLNWGQLFADGTLTDNWNEEAEDYVVAAGPARNPGRGVVWTRPYWDTVGNGWLVSALRPLYNGSEFTGDVGIDLSLNRITDELTGVRVLNTGHAFLIDGQGNAIVHPGLQKRLDEARAKDPKYPKVALTELEDGGRQFIGTVNSMLGLSSGLDLVTYSGGKRHYIAYAPVATTGFILGIVLPEDEVLEAIRAAEKETDAATNEMRLNTILVFSVAGAAVFGVGLAMANRIVRPIRHLTDSADKMANGDLSGDIPQVFRDELGLLASSFRNILTTLRLGNIAYYEGDARRAQENYTSALALFEATDNLKGAAMCYNNLGNIYRLWKEYGTALDHYEKALAADRKRGDRKGEARRLLNMGIAVRELKNYDKAMEYYGSAMNIANELGDRDCLSDIYTNMGILYHLMGDSGRAYDFLDSGLRLNSEVGDRRGVAKCLNNLAVVEKTQGRYREAVEHLQSAIKICEAIEDKLGMANGYSNLARLYEAAGDEAAAQAAREKFTELSRLVARSGKTVIFVIDRSESMMGPKMDAAKAGAVNLLEQKVSDDDNVAVIAFSSDVNIISSLAKKSDCAGQVKVRVMDLEPQGMTSFYDAMGNALAHFKNTGARGPLWVVALTDGEDNTSYRFSVGGRGGRMDICTYARELGIDATIIVIGVGDSVDEDTMNLIVGPQGRYIPVAEAGGADVGLAIKAAYAEAGDIMEEEEAVEGFTPEA